MLINAIEFSSDSPLTHGKNAYYVHLAHGMENGSLKIKYQ